MPVVAGADPAPRPEEALLRATLPVSARRERLQRGDCGSHGDCTGRRVTAPRGTANALPRPRQEHICFDKHIIYWLDNLVTTTFNVVAEPARRELLDLLRGGPRPVGELATLSGLSQPNTSRHLRVLRDAGLVAARPDRQRRLYELRPAGFAELERWLAPYRRLWQHGLDGLERHLDETG